MRIIAEWDEMCHGGTAMMRRCEAFEGETVAEINDAISAKAGGATVMCVGLRNTREDFERYTGHPSRPDHWFADTPEPERAVPQKKWYRRWFGL